MAVLPIRITRIRCTRRCPRVGWPRHLWILCRGVVVAVVAVVEVVVVVVVVAVVVAVVVVVVAGSGYSAEGGAVDGGCSGLG